MLKNAVILFLIIASVALPARAQEYSDLFGGVSLKGWEGDTAYWSVRNGSIVGEILPGKEIKRNTFLIWRGGSVSDFELKVSYRISVRGNSGFNYRSAEVEGEPFAMRGYQADIDGFKRYTGQNYEELGRRILAYPGQQVLLPEVPGPIEEYAKNNVWTASKLIATLGNADSLKQFIKDDQDWNELRVVARGNRLQHYINGVLMSDVTDDDTKNRKMEGLLGFQVHVGPPMAIYVRSIQLRKL